MPETCHGSVAFLAVLKPVEFQSHDLSELCV